MQLVVGEDGHHDSEGVLRRRVRHESAADGVHALDVARARKVECDALEHGEESLLARALALREEYVLGQRARHVIEDGDQLVPPERLVEQLAHPLLLTAAITLPLVLLRHYLVDTGQYGPRYTPDRVGNALPSPTFELAARLAAVLEHLEHLEPLGAALALDFRVLSAAAPPNLLAQLHLHAAQRLLKLTLVYLRHVVGLPLLPRWRRLPCYCSSS